MLFCLAAAGTGAALAQNTSGAKQSQSITIPNGPASQIDGVLHPDEWAGAAEVSIEVEPGWTVNARLKHDAENIYFAFTGTERNGRRLFPEIMFDPELAKGEKWSAGQWWFHVSNNLCEGRGEYNVYERGGVFQCAHTKSGWEGNNPPGKSQAIEVRISMAKLGLKMKSSTSIRLALDVTDASGEADQLFRFWPARAQIEKPRTWGTAILE